MNATELSLENYVFDTINKRIVQVHGIEPTWNEVWVNYANGLGVYKLEINQIEPIPLNEEWLSTLGFIFHPFLGFWLSNWGTNGVEFIRFDEHYKMFSFQLGTGKYKIVKFVHQLQNLYFALTGEELTIKE